MLNCDKANRILWWKPRYSFDNALEETVGWFKEYQRQLKSGKEDMYDKCRKQIEKYVGLEGLKVKE